MKKIFISILTIISISNLYSIWETNPRFTNEGSRTKYIIMNSSWFEGRPRTTCGSIKLTPKPDNQITLKSMYSINGNVQAQELGQLVLPQQGKTFKFDDAGAKPHRSYAIFCYGAILGTYVPVNCDEFLKIEWQNSQACTNIKADFNELKMNKGS